jgi:hypothetical protein
MRSLILSAPLLLFRSLSKKGRSNPLCMEKSRCYIKQQQHPPQTPIPSAFNLPVTNGMDRSYFARERIKRKRYIYTPSTNPRDTDCQRIYNMQINYLIRSREPIEDTECQRIYKMHIIAAIRPRERKEEKAKITKTPL